MFHICSRINNFYVHASYRNPRLNGSLYDYLLDSMAWLESVDDKEVFVIVRDANAHHSEWLESVSHTDRHGRYALDFCNLFGCEQCVRCHTHIAGNRLDLVMTDAPEIVYLCSMELQWELLITALSVVCLGLSNLYRSTIFRSTVFLKHRTNWDNVRCAVRSFTWNTILRSADTLNAFDRAIGEVICWFVPSTVLRSRSRDKQWFDGRCGRTYDAKQIAYCTCCRAVVQIIGVDLCLFVLRPRESMHCKGVA